MPEKRDYYEVLGVERDATQEDIKKAYRRRARQLHPDVNREDPHAEEHFKELGEAYEALSDAQKRAMYDRFGHAGMNGAAGPGAGGFGGSPFGDMGDLFEAFFGGMGMGGGQTARPDTRGADRRADIEITLEEAAFGAERTIRVPRATTCETCHGRGAETGGPVPCPACAGSGQRRQTANAGIFGMQFTTVVPCDRCGATGEIIPNPCSACGGSGRVRGSEEIHVKVPAGAETGQRIRYAGKGDAGIRGAAAGHLYIGIHVAPHEIFERRGQDLVCEVRLPFTTATLGGKLDVPTLDGSTEIEVPPGTAPGHVFRIRGEGMPAINSSHRGDLHAVATIDVPTDLSERQRELLREFAKERGENIDYKRKNVFQRVKDVVTGAMDDYRDMTKDAFGN